MTADFKVPPVDKALVEHLNKVFSGLLTVDHIDISERELGAKIGEQRVLNYLASHLRNQQEDFLTDVL